MDSWELFRRLVAARPEDPLWGILFRRCQTLVRVVLLSRSAGRRRVDMSGLDDLSQDVMERLISDGRRVIRRFAGERDGTFESYIRRIAENILRDQFRRDAHRRRVELSFAPEELWRLEAALPEGPVDGASADPESAVVMRELDESVDRVLRRISLDGRQHALNRRLYQLYFRDRCSIPQIARLRAVPLSASSVARRIALIRGALQTALAALRDPVRARPAAHRPAAHGHRQGRKRGISR